MAIALDTNIFIYAHHEQFPEHSRVRSFFENLLKKPDSIYWSWQIYYEYLRIVTHSKVLVIPLSLSEAKGGLSSYLADSRFQILIETSDHASFFHEICVSLPSARGNFIHDCHYAALLKEHGIDQIVTTDMDFKKFDFLKIINPLKS